MFAASRVQIHFCILSFSFQILFVYFPQRSNYFFWYLVDLAVHTSTYKPNPFILLIGLNLWINTQTISSALQFWKYIKQTSIHERIFVLHMIFIISIWIDKLRAHFARTSFEFWSKAIQWEKLEVQMLTSWKRSILIKTLFWHVSKDFMLIFWKMSSCYCSKIWLEHFELCPKCEKRTLFYEWISVIQGPLLWQRAQTGNTSGCCTELPDSKMSANTTTGIDIMKKLNFHQKIANFLGLLEILQGC